MTRWHDTVLFVKADILSKLLEMSKDRMSFIHHSIQSLLVKNKKQAFRDEKLFKC